MPTNRKKPPSTPLTRDRIVGAALAIVDRDGLTALSMRRLGADLGVDPMAVYYHVPNKEALFDALVEAVMAEIDLTADDPAGPAEERIVTAARAYRDAMLAHANALPIILSRGPRTPVALRPVELLIGILRDAGLPPAQAVAGMNAIAATVRGSVGTAPDGSEGSPNTADVEVLAEQFPADEFPYVRESLPCWGESRDEDFEFGVCALARGLIGGAAGQAAERPSVGPSRIP